MPDILQSPEEVAQVPLVVDLDGTLLSSDLLLETGMDYLRHQPLGFYKPLFWLLQGKINLKENLACMTDIDVSILPYNAQVIEFIQSARTAGRPVVLATASHLILAEKIFAHLKLFDEVLATTQSCNLSAEYKRNLLVEKYGERRFDYIGNSTDDLVVWSSARRAYVVCPPDSHIEQKAKAQGNVEKIIYSSKPDIKTWMKALRLHQWMKNVLIFIPLLASHQFISPPLLWNVLLAFFFFGLCASSVYLLNDLLDLADDRHHHRKRYRPFAAGVLSIHSGLIFFPLLLIFSIGGAALLLPWKFSVVLIGYYILTLAYSLSLKRKMIVDVIALAMLYTIRIVAGATACGLALTFWILAFSMFIFLSLALVKRYAELLTERDKGNIGKTRGRGYYTDDLEMIASLGAASGYISVMVLAFYINDSSTALLYSHPKIIWLACPLLLFWVSRIWMLTHRGEMHDDPVIFAIKDKISLLVGFLFVFIFGIAI